MTPDELRPILVAYRKQVQQAWSKETAHALFPSRAGSPDGQCGVTSAWLMKRLDKDRGMFAWFVEGMVCDEAEELDHCWLELGHSPNRVVVDITADQMEGLRSRPVVCATAAELQADRIVYTPKRRMVASDLKADSGLQSRLALLECALS